MTQPAQPAPGEVITAKYKGTCTRSGQDYAPGARIALDEFGYYLDGQPDPGGTLWLSGGQGYGHSLQQIGDVVWSATWNAETKSKEPEQAVVITRSKARYYRAVGMSFGVGDERGYVYTALARPATPEEAAPLLARREAARLAQEQRADLARGVRALEYAEDHDTPEGRNLHPEGRRLLVDGGFTIYGGGKELVLDVDGLHLWVLCNNGADGDFWAANNVATGGAGAIGRRVPLTDERRIWVERHWPEPEAAEQNEDDDGRL